MAATPLWKIYRDNECVASFVYLEDAACFVGATGGDVRSGHSKKEVLWREGQEEFSASDSCDRAASIMTVRFAERLRAAGFNLARAEGRAP